MVPSLCPVMATIPAVSRFRVARTGVWRQFSGLTYR